MLSVLDMELNFGGSCFISHITTCFRITGQITVEQAKFTKRRGQLLAFNYSLPSLTQSKVGHSRCVCYLLPETFYYYQY